MKKTARRSLNHSCAWIRQHWNADNLDVPDEFLSLWIYDTSEHEEEPSGFHLAVFSFGYLQHDLLSHNVPPGVSRSVSASELIGLFHKWQMKLALVEIHRRTELRVKPMPLFAFSDDDRIEAWAERELAEQ